MPRGSKWTISDISPLKFNCVVVALASFMFFGGWWVMIDVILQYTKVFDATRIYHLPGILGTVAMICTNIIPTSYLYDSIYTPEGSCCTPFLAKTCLFVFLMASFGCLIGAGFILCYDFLMDQSKYQYPGYGIIVQNGCIFLCNMMMRFCRKRDAM